MLPIPYLPSVSWFVKVLSNPTVRWNTTELYDKRSPRNRCVIATARGAQTLSIPLAGGRNQHIAINTVQTADDARWVRQHTHALQTAYGKSPYFIHYAEPLFGALSQKHENLAALNLSLIEFLLKQLRIDVEVITERAGESRVYLTDKPAKIRYPQVFEDKVGFVPDCSVVDLLFNCGPDSRDVLTRFKS
jgi:hypothetical protein